MLNGDDILKILDRYPPVLVCEVGASLSEIDRKKLILKLMDISSDMGIKSTPVVIDGLESDSDARLSVVSVLSGLKPLFLVDGNAMPDYGINDDLINQVLNG